MTNVIDRFLLTKDPGWKLDELTEEIDEALDCIHAYADVYIMVDKNGVYLIKRDKVTTVRVSKGRTKNPDLEVLEELGLIEDTDTE
jgi:transposase